MSAVTKQTDEQPELKSERIHARLTPANKRLVAYAAALAGQPVSDFMVDAAREKALATIEKYRVWKLTEEQSTVFARAILDPTPPSARMRERFQRYRELVEPPFVDQDGAEDTA